MSETPAKTRRPYVWVEPEIPGLADLLAGGERRRRWWRHWSTSGPKDLLDLAIHHGLRLLPPAACSAIGAAIYRHVGPRLAPVVAERAARHLRRIRPELSEPEIARMVVSHYESMGRVMTEFSVLRKLLTSGRVTSEGTEIALRALAEGPVIFVSCHTGNWEVFAPVMKALGIRWSIVYTPPRRAIQAAIANRVRRLSNPDLLPPGKSGTRAMIRTLQAGGALSMFCDETHEGRVMAPFFDRAPHLDGNLAVVVRLARMTGAQIVVGHCVRTESCRFHIKVQGPIVLPSHGDASAPPIDDVIALNAVIEPIVRANAGSWYFLDNRFE